MTERACQRCGCGRDWSLQNRGGFVTTIIEEPNGTEVSGPDYCWTCLTIAPKVEVESVPPEPAFSSRAVALRAAIEASSMVTTESEARAVSKLAEFFLAWLEERPPPVDDGPPF